MYIKQLLAAVAMGLAMQGAVASAQEAAPDLGVPVELLEEVRGSFIFVFADHVPATGLSGRAEAIARAAGGRVTHMYRTAIRGFSAKMPSEAAARIAAGNADIAYYERDGIAYAFPKPPWAGGGGGGSCSVQQTPWGVSRVGGPVAGATGSAWVIDTGVDLDNPDLNVDALRSANFVTFGKDSPDDGNGHGTHVAGTIAAIDNACDVVGVAPGATIVSVRVLSNNGSGSFSGVIAGIDYVAANGVPGDVANMSLGGPFNQSVNDAVENAAGMGILFAVAAGNSSDDASNYSPASASGPNIWTVSAIDIDDNFASFSNFGNPPVDCAAPGVEILSTKRGGGTTTMSGTSMATPHVAGVLLLAGVPAFDGVAQNDPDGSPDPICHD